jgi:hypothetical protein
VGQAKGSLARPNGTGHIVLQALCGRARKMDSNHRAIPLPFESKSMLTDDIFQCKIEVKKVGKDVRAHPWWKNDEGLKLRQLICKLNNRIVHLQK